MNQNNWTVIAFKDGKLTVVEPGIISYTLAISKSVKYRKEPKFEGCLVRPIRSNLINQNNG